MWGFSFAFPANCCGEPQNLPPGVWAGPRHPSQRGRRGPRVEKSKGAATPARGPRRACPGAADSCFPSHDPEVGGGILIGSP